MTDFAASDFAYRSRDTRPGLIVCAYDNAHPEWDLVEDLAGTIWDPPGARTVLVKHDAPEALARGLNEAMATPGVRGMLLVGTADEGAEVLIPVRALNRVPDGTSRAVEHGPGVARATAPAGDIIRALAQAGHPARMEPEGATGTGGYLLYQVLASVPDNVLTPSVGLLLVPPGMDAELIREVVKKAAAAVAASLTPLPRQAAS